MNVKKLPKSKRGFRTEESLREEREVRPMIARFLSSRGFTEIRDSYDPAKPNLTQTIQARVPTGNQLITARIKLCWRARKAKTRARTYVAAQLIAKIRNGDWKTSIRTYAERANKAGISHFCFVAREGDSFSHALFVPVEDLWTVWKRQRDVSEELIGLGKLGRRTKNHAENGSSPTLWLEDEDAPEIADAVLGVPGVFDAILMPQRGLSGDFDSEVAAAYDVFSGVDFALLGRDEAIRYAGERTYVPRSESVRRAVIARSRGRCERAGCGLNRSYPGFLDVHHILGVDQGDRVYNCVALCPNCHREAHIAHNRGEINKLLLEYAMQFK